MSGRRPLPSGRISVPHAVAWAVIAGASGACLLATKVTPPFCYYVVIVSQWSLIFCFYDKAVAD